MFVSRRASEGEGPVQALSAADPDDRVEALGFEIAVRCWGRGRPVLCLHDLGSGSRDFETFAAAASDRFEVIALDWPGHGWSACDGLAPGPQRWAEVFDAVADSLHLDAPVVIAHGYAASAALIAAARDPQRVSALVLCDPAGLAPAQPAASWREKLVVAPTSWAEPAERLRRRFRLAEAEAATCALIEQAHHELARAYVDLASAPARITAPVWLVWSDPDYPREAARMAARAFPYRNEQAFDGPEPPFVEQPQAFLQAFEAFLARAG